MMEKRAAFMRLIKPGSSPPANNGRPAILRSVQDVLPPYQTVVHTLSFVHAQHAALSQILAMLPSVLQMPR